MEAQFKSPYMTRNEAAEYLLVSTDTIDRMCRDGKLKAVKVAIRSLGRIRILRSSVYAILPPDLPR